MNETDFINFFPNVGKLFQPDENETVQVIAKINSLASQQTSQENFVFTVLNDLAMYYSNFSSLNSVSSLITILLSLIQNLSYLLQNLKRQVLKVMEKT